jgi:hypothetical protein
MKKIARSGTGVDPAGRSRLIVPVIAATALALLVIVSAVVVSLSNVANGPDEKPPFLGTRSTVVVNGIPSRAGPYLSKKLRTAEAKLKTLLAQKDPDEAAIRKAETELERLAAGSHQHAAYGIFKCDRYEPAIDGFEFADPFGIHSHDDGLIHMHPFLAVASGRKATLGYWMDSVKLRVERNELSYLTPGLRPRTGSITNPSDFSRIKAFNSCLDDSGRIGQSQISVFVWDSPTDRTANVYRNRLRDLRLEDGKIYAFVVAPDGTQVPMPPSAARLAGPTDMPPK